jgi:hypothetical protein
VAPDSVPKAVIGLTHGAAHNPRFLLDTNFGTVQWYACPQAIRTNLTRATITECPYEFFLDGEEGEWRANGATWAIGDFFEEVREQFRRLNFVLLSKGRVVHVWEECSAEYEGVLEGVRGIYWAHGWPDLERYEKETCWRAVGEFIGEYCDRFELQTVGVTASALTGSQRELLGIGCSRITASVSLRTPGHGVNLE